MKFNNTIIILLFIILRLQFNITDMALRKITDRRNVQFLNN